MTLSTRNMEKGIIADIQFLEENYIPQQLQCRDSQRKEFAYSLSQFKHRT